MHSKSQSRRHAGCPLPQLLLLLALLGFATGVARASPPNWVGIWATAPIEEEALPEVVGGQGVVVRQIVRISTSAQIVRLRLSNEYGSETLVLDGLRLALAGPGGTIQASTDRPVLFSGGTRVSIPPMSVCVSDPLAFPAPAHSDLAITSRLVSLPQKLAGHPGSRTTSYVKPGAGTADVDLAGAKRIVHWYFLSGIETLDDGTGRAAVVCLGDSITDGYGCSPDRNTRWTDVFSQRLRADPSFSRISVLNLGIGGGRLLRPGTGPSGLARLSRDVFGQAGVRWLIVELGVNDLGTRIKAKSAGLPYADPKDIIAGYRDVLSACRAHGIRVALSTITPFAGATWYSTPEIEIDREVINRWVREEAPCDLVLDFDAALRDPADPNLLLPAYNSGDNLHPSMAGYRRMADFVPLAFFVPTQTGTK